MKRYILSIALVLGLALCTSTAWALTPIHTAFYDWYYNSQTQSYGTYVYQTVPYPTYYTIGDVSGEVIAEVTEKVWDVEDDGTVGKFSWTVYNDDENQTLIGGDGYIYSFHVLSGGFEPFDWTVPYQGIDGLEWSFDYDGVYYSWEAPEDGIGIGPGEALDTMIVYVDTTNWTVSNGAINYFVPVAGAEGQYVRDVNFGNGYWRTSHPSFVPEPSSMLLFGVGILGLFGIGKRRRA